MLAMSSLHHPLYCRSISYLPFKFFNFLDFCTESFTTQTLFSNIIGIDDVKFGITEIYPTNENGSERYLNMNNPFNDSLLSITFDPNITRQTNGSWRSN